MGGLEMVTYLGLAYIPNCTHTHTHTFGLGGWVGGLGMVTYLGLAYLPNCRGLAYHLGLGLGQGHFGFRGEIGGGTRKFGV